jgi:hypothetical protein
MTEKETGGYVVGGHILATAEITPSSGPPPIMLLIAIIISKLRAKYPTLTRALELLRSSPLSARKLLINQMQLGYVVAAGPDGTLVPILSRRVIEEDIRELVQIGIPHLERQYGSCVG